MLTSLRSLRSLSIRRDSYSLGDPDEIRELVKKLPPTLHKLEFHFQEAEMIFLARHDAGIEGNAFLANSSENRLWDISSFFPKLQTLKLRGEAVFTPLEVSSMPSSLTSLTVSWIAGVVHCDAYPKGLVKCGVAGITANFPSAEELRQLPPNLVKFFFSRPATITVDQAAALPRTIAHTRIQYEKWSKEMAAALPPHLQYFNCPAFPKMEDTSLFGMFPTQLTYLILTRAPEYIINRHILKSLPRTLNSLEIARISWQNIQSGDFPALGVFSCWNNDNATLTDEIISVLPTSLWTFNYAGNGGSIHSLNALSRHAPGLEKLEVKISPPEEGDPEFLSFSLPLRLSELALNDGYGDIQVDGNSGPTFILQPFGTLPPMLVYLEVSSIAVSQLGSLPRSLQHLRADDLLNNWEPNRPVDEETGDFLAPTMYEESSIFQNLPPGLVSLQFEAAIPVCDPLAFAAIPRNLGTFIWRTSQPHDRRALKYLPQKLSEIEIHLDKMTNEDFGLLPRSLRFLGITAEDTSAVTLKAAHSIPPNISQWSMSIGRSINLPGYFATVQDKLAKASNSST